MQDLLAALEATALAADLRQSRWGYAGVNTAHVMGVALLFGAIAPLDLRLLGVWRERPLGALLGVLRPVAAAGAALAVATGLLLFAVRAREYAALPVFQAKLALIGLGLANAAVLARPGVETASRARQRLVGAASLAAWAAALVCGRLIGYF